MASFLEELRRARAAIDRGEDLETKVYETALEYIYKHGTALPPQTTALVAAVALGATERATLEVAEGDYQDSGAPRVLTKSSRLAVPWTGAVSETPLSAIAELRAQLTAMLRRLDADPPTSAEEWRTFEALLEFTQRIAGAERRKLDHVDAPDYDDGERDNDDLKENGVSDWSQIIALVNRHFGSPDENVDNDKRARNRAAALLILRDIGRHGYSGQRQLTALVDRHFGTPDELEEEIAEGRDAEDRARGRAAVLLMLRDLGHL